LLLAAIVLLASACQRLPEPESARAVPHQQAKNETTGPYGPAATVGTIRSPLVAESSGLVASRSLPGIYWTHNDSGDGPFLYAITATGELRGVLRVKGARAIDWEDIAAGPGPIPKQSYLYVGDIGDNNSVRPEIVVYRILEPSSLDSRATKEKPQESQTAEAIRLRYPDGKHDAEALMVYPTTGDLYIVNKVAFASANVYKAVAPLNPNHTTTLTILNELKLTSLFGGIITGGDISADGRRVALCDYFGGYEAVLPQSDKTFDDIWKQRFSSINLGKQKQREAIAYRLDGKALLTTSEGKSPPVIQVERR
jgi:hypothetical protein